jgi:hypothetical protein
MPSEVDRLIEEGLGRYGSGDVDGALAVWEQALALDPDNAQAQSYVDYARANYQLLTTGGPDVDDGAPFGIDEDPEYQIEVSPGALSARDDAPIYLDPHDTGWGVDDEPISIAPIMRSLEIEADEPPLGGMPFDDATREFLPGPPAISIPLATEDDGGFTREESTQGFSTQVTGVKKRDHGFVQATELKVTLRTPTGAIPALAHAETVELSRESAPAELPPPPATPAAATTPARKKTRDMASGSMPALARPVETREDVVTAALPPLPRSAGSIDEAVLELGNGGGPQPGPALPKGGAVTVDLPNARGTTRDFPLKPRPPAGAPAPGESSERPTVDEVGLTSAPTRDLGLRPGEPPPGPAQPKESEAPRARDASRSLIEMHAEGTRHDIVLPFDPIDARSAQILEEVDVDAPANEAKEDRVRRRITRLLERAAVWNLDGEYDKAVTAADLALSEDPNSALAQKLVHRNREAIQSTFQNFLGDLQRQPQLARPLHELSTAPISPRAAFLLSRIDGSLSIDEILDVSGMPRVEAYRHLCQLFLRNILR